MSILEALFLGILQGLTEFLPVSSSGHLALAQHLMGFKNLADFVLFDLICHMGTLLAIATIFKKEILEAIKDRRLFGQVLLGTLPLVPLVLLIKPLKSLFERVDLLGYFFILTALLLWLGVRFGNKPTEEKKERPLDPLYVGLFQALALLPGVSRSGSTISGARLLDWPVEKAITFSFLLAIPAILGAFTLEVYSFYKHPTPFEGLTPLFIGFFSSYFVGLFALNLLIRTATKKNLLPFAWYCLILGFLTLALTHYA